jgi:hypothetical protein
MIISNKLSDGERHYLNNLLMSGAGEIPNEDGETSEKATHIFIIDKGAIIGARKIIRKEENK